MGGQNKLKEEGEGQRFFSNLINAGGSWNFKQSVNIGNEWKKRHKYLMLMLNLKVSKQRRSEVSKNKVIIKRVSNQTYQ